MLGFVTRLVGDDGGPPDDPEVVDERPRTGLYECPDCGSVYLSEAKATCRSCETDVEAVPTERDLGFGSGDQRHD